MSLQGHQHLWGVARQRDAGHAHAKFCLAQAEADVTEAKVRCEAAEKSKGQAVKRQDFLDEFKPVLDLKELRSGKYSAKHIQAQIMWHRRAGRDVHIPPYVNRMKRAEAWVVMVHAVRRHLRRTSTENGNPFITL